MAQTEVEIQARMRMRLSQRLRLKGEAEDGAEAERSILFASFVSGLVRSTLLRCFILVALRADFGAILFRVLRALKKS